MSSIPNDSVFNEVLDVNGFYELDAYDDAHKYAREWYRVLPNCNTPSFPSFIYSSVELAIEVCEMKDVQLSVGSISTAAVDIEQGKIVIAPHTLLSSAIEDRGFRKWEETEVMVAATNGMIIHEAMHIRESPKDLREAEEAIKEKHGKPLKAGPLLKAFINTVEDIYIEWEARLLFPTFIPFLEAAHEFWLPASVMEKRIDEFVMSREMETERYDVGKFIDLLIALKNWQLADAPIWRGIIHEYNEALKQFRHLKDKEDRLDEINTVWRKICEDPRLRWDEVSEYGALGAVQLFDEDAIMISIDEDTLAELERKETECEIRGDKLVDEINKELEKRNIVIKITKGQTELSTIPKMEVTTVREGPSRLNPDSRFIPLAKRLRSSLTRNYAPGQPLRKGPKLVSTRLQRIVTDGKIFTYPEVRPKTGRDYEVIVLVDCSGSMAGGHPNKINEAMRAGLAAWMSMKGARIRTCLLGHSSDGFRDHGRETPILYVFGLHKDPIARVAKRAHQAIHGHNMLFNNYDGFAVSKACEYFSERPTKKWLIVISDGQPSGKSYHGIEAIEHTRIEANKARAKGIDVVSITIEDGAYDTNDRIYGKEKNIHTKSSKVLLDLVDAMFVKHKGEGNGKA